MNACRLLPVLVLAGLLWVTLPSMAQTKTDILGLRLGMSPEAVSVLVKERGWTCFRCLADNAIWFIARGSGRQTGDADFRLWFGLNLRPQRLFMVEHGYDSSVNWDVLEASMLEQFKPARKIGAARYDSGGGVTLSFGFGPPRPFVIISSVSLMKANDEALAKQMNTPPRF